jgi:PAS domain S-box-containing protein
MRTPDYPAVETPDLLLAAFERANDAVVIVDSDLHVSHFNTAAELLWGLNRTEMLGCHVGRLGLGDLQQHPIATSASDRINGGDTIQ